MPSIYSKELIEETVAVFREEDGLELSPEIASEYLDSLADLFLVLANKERLVEPLWHDEAVIAGFNTHEINQLKT